MGRRRTKDLDLPPRLYLRHSTYYYVSADKQWHRLGKDRGRALRLWADLECVPTAATVGDILRRYLADCTGHLKPSARSKYARYVNTLVEKFGELPADDMTRFAIARWRDGGKVKPVWFNGCLSVLRSAYRKAGEWGWATTNEAQEVALNPTTARGRYISDEEFRAIRDKAVPWLQLAMDLAYLTGMRESDVVALRWNVISDRLYVEQVKTGNRQAFEITPALRSILEAARRRPIVGLFVIATDKGRPITTRRLQKAFSKARAESGVVDARFHDIRGKAATDAADAGMDYQALLGHATKKMADRYVKTRRTIKAPTLAKRL